MNELVTERDMLKLEVDRYCVQRIRNGLHCYDCKANGSLLCCEDRHFLFTPIKELRWEVDVCLGKIQGELPKEHKPGAPKKRRSKGIKKSYNLGNHNRAREVVRVNKEGYIIGEWPSVTDAAKGVGVCQSTAFKMLNGFLTNRLGLFYKDEVINNK